MPSLAKALTGERRFGAIGAAAVLALVLLQLLSGVLSRFQTRGAGAALASYAEARGMDPMALVAGAVRSHRFIFLTDVDGAAAPKRIAIAAVETAAQQGALDALVLEIAETEQPYIDAYLRSDPENVGILLERPAALRTHAGAARQYLDLYRKVWWLNRDLPAAQRIRVVAADFPDWPPRGAVSSRTLARHMAERDAHMAERLEYEVLSRTPHARVLFFVGGYHGLQSGHAEVQLSGGGTLEIEWLGKRLRERYPGDVYTILIDGAHGGMPAPGTYTGTSAAAHLRRHLGGRSFAARIDEHFDFLHQPIRENGGPGLTIEMRPRDYRLRDVADGYIYAGNR